MGGGGGGGRQKATQPGSPGNLTPASRRADRFLPFNPMKRLILQTNRISRPAVHYMGREKAQLALETIHCFLSQPRARESFAGNDSHLKLCVFFHVLLQSLNQQQQHHPVGDHFKQ